MEISNKEKIWGFILAYTADHGQGPTLQKIADHMGFKHRQQVTYYMKQLKKEGKLVSTERIKNSIQIVTSRSADSYSRLQEEQERIRREQSSSKE